MKILAYFLIAFSFINASAQVYRGNNLHSGTAKSSFYIISNQDEKDLNKDLEDYLDGFGKVSSPEKYLKRLEKLKGQNIADELAYIDIVRESTKKMEKVVFFFLDKNEKALSSFEMKDREAIAFVENFQKYTLRNLEEELLKENIKLAQDNLAEANKYLSKTEKALETNLKEQEKLGKKLDASPEKLTKALSEKEEIVNELYSDPQAEEEKAKEELVKASTKKEKEIAKIQKEKEKAETKLSKKEKEFDALKDNLFDAKNRLKATSAVLEDAKKALDNFK
ncbi:hypothetical protein EGI22_20290 [Lacihabitans sp. LS3-19]|uniref:hypothetical protein n=1 Tax=Lacihabitans sp. LS3-19 TaxID=2487335 RepID=UPI0020CC036E|nr:hypothetical protein [Lacihabitans sp. LS3-19]MCP9770251.1 hypothetical protein [Lacihabitans sp. LS3-19]